jgi:hypothetical protein
LDQVLGGEVDQLISELSGGHFHRTLLDQRFDEVGLDNLSGTISTASAQQSLILQ